MSQIQAPPKNESHWKVHIIYNEERTICIPNRPTNHSIPPFFIITTLDNSTEWALIRRRSWKTNREIMFYYICACTLARAGSLSCSRLNSFGSWNNCFWKFIRKTEETHTQNTKNEQKNGKSSRQNARLCFFILVYA